MSLPPLFVCQQITMKVTEEFSFLRGVDLGTRGSRPDLVIYLDFSLCLTLGNMKLQF